MIVKYAGLDRDLKKGLYLNFKLIVESSDGFGEGAYVKIIDENMQTIYTTPNKVTTGDVIYDTVYLDLVYFKKPTTDFILKYYKEDPSSDNKISVSSTDNLFINDNRDGLRVNSYNFSIDNIDIKKEIINDEEYFKIYLFWSYDNYSIMDLKVKPIFRYQYTNNSGAIKNKDFTTDSYYICKSKSISMQQMSSKTVKLNDIITNDNTNESNLINMILYYKLEITSGSHISGYPLNGYFKCKASSINDAPVIKLDNIEVLEKGKSFQLKLDSILRDSNLDDVRYVINDNQGNVIFQEDYFRFTPRIDNITFDYDIYAFNSLFLNLTAEISDNLYYSYKRSFKYPLYDITNLRIRRDRLVWDVRNFSNSILKTTVQILDMYNNVVYEGDTVATRLEKQYISVTDDRVITLLQEVPDEEFNNYYKFRIKVRCDDENFTDYVEFENGTLVSTQHHYAPIIEIYENKYPDFYYDVSKRGKNYDHLLRDLENNKRLHLVFNLKPAEGSAVGDYCRYVVSDDSGNIIYISNDDVTLPQLIELNVPYDFTKKLYNKITIRVTNEYGNESTNTIELASYYIRKAEIFTSDTSRELPDSQKIYFIADNYYEGDIKIVLEVRDFSKIDYNKREILKTKDTDLSTKLAAELETFKDYLIDPDSEVFKIISEAPIIREQELIIPNTIETIHQYLRINPKIYYNEYGIPYDSITEDARDEFGNIIYEEGTNIPRKIIVKNPLKCLLRIESCDTNNYIRYKDKYRWVYRYLPPILNKAPQIMINSSNNEIDPKTNILKSTLYLTIGDEDGDWINFNASDRYGNIENRDFYDIGFDKSDDIVLTKTYNLNELNTSLIQWNITCFDEEGLYDSEVHRIPLHYISNIIYDGNSLYYKCKLYTKKSICTSLEILDDEGYLYAKGKDNFINYSEELSTIIEDIDICKFDPGNYRYRIKVNSPGENWNVYYPSINGELIEITNSMINNAIQNKDKAINIVSMLNDASTFSLESLLNNLYDIYGNIIPLNKISASDKSKLLNILSNYHDSKTFQFNGSLKECYLSSKPLNAKSQIFNGFSSSVILKIMNNETITSSDKTSIANTINHKLAKSFLEFINMWDILGFNNINNNDNINSINDFIGSATSGSKSKLENIISNITKFYTSKLNSLNNNLLEIKKLNEYNNKETVKLINKFNEVILDYKNYERIKTSSNSEIINILNDIYGYTEITLEDGSKYKKNNLITDYENSIKAIPTSMTNYNMPINTYTYNLDGYPLEFKLRESEQHTNKYNIEKYGARVFIDGKKIPDQKINSQLLYDGLNKIYVGKNDIIKYAEYRNKNEVFKLSNPENNAVVDVLITKNLLNLAENKEPNELKSLSDIDRAVGLIYDKTVKSQDIDNIKKNGIQIDTTSENFSNSDFSVYIIRDEILKPLSKYYKSINNNSECKVFINDNIENNDRIIIMTNNPDTKGILRKTHINNLSIINDLKTKGIYYNNISSYHMDMDLSAYIIRPFRKPSKEGDSIVIENKRINLFRFSVNKKDGMVNLIIKDPVYIGDIVVLTTNKIYERQYLNTNQMYGGYTSSSTIRKPTYFIPISLFDSLTGNDIDITQSDILDRIEIYIDGYLAIPERDYILCKANNKLNLPDVILFRNLLFEGTEIEIFYYGQDFIGSSTFVKNASNGVINVSGLKYPLCRGTFSVYCNGKKVPDDKIFITGSKQLTILAVPSITSNSNYFVRQHFPNNSIVKNLLGSVSTSTESAPSSPRPSTFEDQDCLKFLQYVYDFVDPSDNIIATLDGNNLNLKGKIGSLNSINTNDLIPGDGYILNSGEVYMWNGIEWISLGFIKEGKFDFIRIMHEDLKLSQSFLKERGIDCNEAFGFDILFNNHDLPRYFNHNINFFGSSEIFKNFNGIPYNFEDNISIYNPARILQISNKSNLNSINCNAQHGINDNSIEYDIFLNEGIDINMDYITNDIEFDANNITKITNN